jgi:anti-sigma regulatory factor (Ser/Thr protein kinase)
MARARTPAPVPIGTAAPSAAGRRDDVRNLQRRPARGAAPPHRRRGATSAQVQVQKIRAKRLCRRRLQWLCACGRMRISAYVPRGAGERTVMTALPLSLAGNEASGVDCCWLAPVLQMAAVASGNWPLWPEPGSEGWTCFPRVAIRSLDMKPKPVRAARDFAVATVQRWGAGECADDVAIVVSELVTNALRHALPEPAATGPPGQVRLGLLEYGPWLLCAVADPSQATPVPRPSGSLAETGRGLQMICALSDLWGYTEPGDAGKIVWAMFTVRRAAPSRARFRQAPRRQGALFGTSADARPVPHDCCRGCRVRMRSAGSTGSAPLRFPAAQIASARYGGKS